MHPSRPKRAARRGLVALLTALALATLVGFSAPGLALAHGHAHHEADERAARAHGHDRT